MTSFSWHQHLSLGGAGPPWKLLQSGGEVKAGLHDIWPKGTEATGPSARGK